MKSSTLLLLLFLMQTAIGFAQQKLVLNGVITLSDARMLGFKNMTITADKVSFTNVATNEWVNYSISEVSLIEDDDQKVIYKGIAPKPKEILVSEAAKDTLFRPNYPDGIYKTKDDFINKTPSSTPFLRPKGLIGIEKPLLTTIEDACFFYDMEDTKVKTAFAISYKGYLYFRIGAILENRNKTDRAQDSNFTNGFVRVLTGGDNYFYTEADLANAWAQGLAYGGIGGAPLANSMTKGKGIVWDFKNKEFNIFKNCKDYNSFIVGVYPEGVQSCDSNQPDMQMVRLAVERIK